MMRHPATVLRAHPSAMLLGLTICCAGRLTHGAANLQPISKVAVVSASKHHTATVIWLHGLGERGKDWSGTAHHLKASFKHVRWLFPTAQLRAITAHPGHKVPAWFDFTSYKLRHDDLGFVEEDHDGLRASTRILQALVEEEITNGIGADRIVIGGFSQGAAVALNLACKGADFGGALAGVVTVAGWVPRTGNCATPSRRAAKVNALLLHGGKDKMMPAAAVELQADLLRERGMEKLDFLRIEGLGHASSGEVMESLREFMTEHLQQFGPMNTQPSLDAHLPEARPARHKHEL